MLIIHGASLAGLACAARLSRLGHEVALVTDELPFGSPWNPYEGPGGHLVDDLSPVIALPSAWRDLFKKSGGHLQTELNRARLEFAPAPAAQYLLSTGETFQLPAERGAQFQAISTRFGTSAAEKWRDLLDELGQVWNAYRRYALEDLQPITPTAQQELWLTRTLADIVAPLPEDLAELVLFQAQSPTAPAISALPLIVERTFGRWQLIDEAGFPQRASVLIDLLTRRLAERGVYAVPLTDQMADIDCRIATPVGYAPEITHEHQPLDTTSGCVEVISATERYWSRPVADGVLKTRVNYAAAQPRKGWAPAPQTSEQWLAQLPICDANQQLRASASSLAGAYPWAELGSAALAVYLLHERLTGQDARPTNVNFTMPRL